MVANVNLNGFEYSKKLSNGSLLNFTQGNQELNNSIFTTNTVSVSNVDENAAMLYEKLAAVQADNGAFLDSWNNLKETIGIGTSAEKCEEAISKYMNGEITLEEASSEIDKFASKQDSSLNLFSNIVTSFAAIGMVALCATGIGTGAAIAIGAATGAATKATVKAVDRGTNEVDGDALNGKDLVKDALSGAVTGGLATFSMGTAGGFKTVGEAAKGCAITGAKTGAISGGANYVIDCTVDEDKDFDFGEFAGDTVMSAVVGAGVGTIMGSTNFTLRDNNILNSGCSLTNMVGEAGSSTGQATLANVVSNSACSANYKILTNRINNLIA